jgi:hypothetical protein
MNRRAPGGEADSGMIELATVSVSGSLALGRGKLGTTIAAVACRDYGGDVVCRWGSRARGLL